uniref:Uncharacterized protein n=1 Tax=Timema douglasi TaxID=61478 RepID=A0A7R8V9W5_TIMDO|nr:unnamed protein product [Timema douglasi]
MSHQSPTLPLVFGNYDGQAVEGRGGANKTSTVLIVNGVSTVLIVNGVTDLKLGSHISNKHLQEKPRSSTQAAMTSVFGQLVVGPPGSGKTTYCHVIGEYLKSIGRKVAIVNIGK